MPVIRVPDDVFCRLQIVAAPLVDTPGTVIERLLDFYEANGGATPGPAGQGCQSNDVPVDASSAAYETYENRNNPHVTIHKVGCSQLRKRGGVHRHNQGGYRAHATLAEAQGYAESTELRPVKLCKYCRPS